MTITERTIMTARELKALSIVGLNQVRRVTSVHYKVKSQSSDSWYDVTHPYKSDGNWVCTCPDHVYRKVDCKHIESVYVSKELRHKIIVNSDSDEIDTNLEFSCKCGSTNFKKDGVRNNKACQIQRYKCVECGKRFCNNIGLRSKVSAKVITASLDLYFKGVSLRQIRQHLLQFYGVNVTHVAIYKWIRKFGEVVTPYVDQLVPNTGGVYHVDEMMVHVRKEQHRDGHYQWLWNLMDSATRYWITSKITQQKTVEEARAVFQDAKRKAPMPSAIVHDGLHSYTKAYKKEFRKLKPPYIQDIRSISVRKKGLNQKIERLNGIFRDREIPMRGMDSKESAQKLIDVYRIYYNHIRVHGTIGTTPAAKAGLAVQGENKWLTLIQNAGKNMVQRPT